MPEPKTEKKSLVFEPGPRPDTMKTPDGRIVSPPSGWICLEPGDAALTRKVKAAGDSWTVQVKKGRKVFSKGVWADRNQIETATADLEVLRSSPQYAKRRVADGARREKKQNQYAGDFERCVKEFLRFHVKHQDAENRMANAVAVHATPIGSGTVARTERIPIEQRAEAAVIAWLRHQTTAYDNMVIPRIKGKRREVRRMLAEHSRRLLDQYRKGTPIDSATCPLHNAINSI